MVEWREQTTRSEPVVEKGDFPITTPSVPLESPLVTPSEAFETVGRRRVARSVLGAVVLLLLVFVAGWWLLREGGPASGPIAEGPPVPVPVYEAVLQIDSEPRWAGVWIDGEELAGLVTPTAMEVGGRMGRKVQLELRQDGKAVAETELVLGPGMPLRWAPTLSLPTETFRIMSRPAGGRVVLDGEPLEQPTPVEVDLDPRGRGRELQLLRAGEPRVEAGVGGRRRQRARDGRHVRGRRAPLRGHRAPPGRADGDASHDAHAA